LIAKALRPRGTIPFRYLVLEAFVVLAASLVSLREFLFSPGFYSYSDQHWPLSSALYPLGYFSPNPLNPPYLIGSLAFLRDVLTWPYFIIFHILNMSVAVGSRVFIFYEFVLFGATAYAFANFALGALEEDSGFRFTAAQAELLKFAIFLFVYANLSSIGLNADGGAFTDSLMLIFMAASIIAIGRWDGIKGYLLSAGLMSLSAILEPDYTSYFIIAIFVSSIAYGAMRRGLTRRLLLSLLSVALSLPAILLILANWIVATPPVPGTSLPVRPYNLGEVKWASGNINHFDVWGLLGHFWSLVTYSPPSVLAHPGVYDLPHLMWPAQVLLPPGALTYAWLLSLFLIPVVAAASLIARGGRRYAIAAGAYTAVAYLFTQQAYLPPLFRILYLVSLIPHLGPIIGMTFALPGHAIYAMTSGYYVMISVAIAALGRRAAAGDPRPRFRRAISRTIRWLPVFLVMALVLFTGWQAFNGSFYPSRAWPGVYYPAGNWVPPSGAYTPIEMPSSLVEAYDLVVRDSGGANVLWIGGPAMGIYTFESPMVANGVSLGDFRYLASNDLKADVYQYLVSHGVKYVVISDQAIGQEGGEAAAFGAYGFSNFSQAYEFLSGISGLRQVYSENGTVVFEVKGAGPFYGSDLLLSYNGSAPPSPLFQVFHELGYNLSLTDQPVAPPVSLDLGSAVKVGGAGPAGPGGDGVLALSPVSIIERGIIEGKLGANSTSLTSSSLFMTDRSWTQDHSKGEYNYGAGVFDTTLWGGYVSAREVNGSFTYNCDRAFVTLSAYSALINGQTAVPVNSNPNGTYLVKFSTSVYWSNSSASPLIYIVGSDGSLRNVWGNSISLNSTEENRTVTAYWIVPANVKYITVRVGISGYSGLFRVNFYNLSVYELLRNGGSMFGYSLPCASCSFNLPPNSYLYVISSNSSGKVLVTILDAENDTLSNVSVLGAVLVDNAFLSARTGDYLVVNSYYNPKFMVVYADGKPLKDPVYGYDESWIFAVGKSAEGKYVVEYSLVQQVTLYAAYALVVAYIAFLIFYPVSGTFADRAYSSSNPRLRPEAS